MLIKFSMYFLSFLLSLLYLYRSKYRRRWISKVPIFQKFLADNLGVSVYNFISTYFTICNPLTEFP